MNIMLPEATQQLHLAIPYNQLANMAALQVLRFKEGAWTFKGCTFDICVFLYGKSNTRSNLKHSFILVPKLQTPWSNLS
jgi:hypothetical protein